MTINRKKRLHRSEVPVEMTWDLSDLFKSEEHWEQRYKKLEEEFNELDVIKDKPFSNGKELYKYLELLRKYITDISQINSYTMLKEFEDYTNSFWQSNKMKAMALSSKFFSIKSYLDTEITYKSKPELDKFITEEPKLNEYKPYLNKIYKMKKHQLSSETEFVLSRLKSLTIAPFNIYLTSKSTDLQYEPFLNEHGEEMLNSLSLFENNYEFSTSYEIRGNSYRSVVKTLKKYENTYAANFATYVRTQVAISRLRNYESATQMMLDLQDTSVEVYENQINTTYKELAPHMQRFVRLKQKVLSIKKMRFCDLKASIAPKNSLDISYDFAKKTIIEALATLGEDYHDFIKTAFNNRWIDYGDNIGKAIPGMCCSIANGHPYVIFNMQNNLRSITVLAHELGHAGVSAFRKSYFNPLNTIYSLYLKEAPSTMNELLVGKYLKDNSSSSEMKILAILQLLVTYYHNFVTHLLEAKFLKRVFEHAEKDKAITAKFLGDTKLNVIKRFWGDAVEIDNDASLTWMRQSHYYGNLRPFIYTAGQTIATNYVLRIQEEGQSAIDCWTNFLKASETQYNDELLKILNIDMTKPEPVVKAVNYIGSLISELESLLL